MLKLNLLPAGYRQKGTVKAAAIGVLLIWAAALAALAYWCNSISNQVVTTLAEANSPANDKAKTTLKALNDALKIYNDTDAAIKPETAFMEAAGKQTPQVAAIMQTIARGTVDGVVIENYTVTPGSDTIPVTAWVKNATVYNAARMALLRNPDFIGVPQMTAYTPGGSASSGPPGAAAPGAGAPPAGPGVPGGPGGPSGQASGGGSFTYPKDKYPDAATVSLPLKIASSQEVPTATFTPGAAGGTPAAGGPPGGPPGGPGATPPPTGAPASTPPPK